MICYQCGGSGCHNCNHTPHKPKQVRREKVMDFQTVVQGTDKLKRGIVWCAECGVHRHVDSVDSMQHGWPKHCGYTMTIDSPEERQATAKSS